MKVTKSQLKKIIAEAMGLEDFVVIPDSEPRDFGYGEGEGRMTKSQLDKLARYSQSLHDKLMDDDDLPEWVQSKVAVAAENIGKVYHYLDYKIRRMEQEGNQVVESFGMQDIPTADEIEEWWEYMTPGAMKAVAAEARVGLNPKRWNAREWESVMDYYVQVEMGDSRGYQRGRNV